MWLVYAVIIFVSLVALFGPMIQKWKTERFFEQLEKDQKSGKIRPGYTGSLDEYFAELDRKQSGKGEII